MSADVIKHKITGLKKAVSDYNEYKRYADEYKEHGTLEGYILFLEGRMPHMNENQKCMYTGLINKSRCGNNKDLLLDLYNHMLDKDMSVNRLSSELNTCLNKS